MNNLFLGSNPLGAVAITGGAYPSVVITAPTCSTVVATKGTITVSAQKVNDLWIIRLPEFGTWTVTATLGGESVSQTINAVQNYDAQFDFGATASLTPMAGVNYTNGIATLTAEKMSSYGKAISNNSFITNATSIVYIDDDTLHYKLSVGDTINLTVNDASYEFVILGFNHDELSYTAAYGATTVTGKAGTALQMSDCLLTAYQMNSSNTNVGGWGGCALRYTLQGDVKNTMDSAWRSVIKTVKKQTSAGNQDPSIVVTNDTLFLLSEVEIFGGEASRTAAGEGTQYAWYSAGNDRVKKSNNAAYTWWERSPAIGYSTYFCNVYSNANSNFGNSDGALGVSFAINI